MRFTVLLSSVALLILLMSCGPNDVSKEFSLAASNSTHINLSKGQPIKPKNGNCPVHSFELPGEGFRAVGSTGGLSTSSLFKNKYGWSYNAGVRANTSRFQGFYGDAHNSAHNKHTAILVVDDFGNYGKYTLGSKAFGLASANLSSQAKLDNYVDYMESIGHFSHGALVFNHVNTILDHMGASYSYKRSNYVIRRYNNSVIRVQAVNVRNYDTERLEEKTSQAITSLFHSGYERVVVNMSFAVVPCDVKHDFDANRAAFPTFEDYALYIKQVNGSTTSLAQIKNVLLTPIPNDPIQLIPGKFGEKDLKIVASAGNYGLSYPLYPAAFDGFDDVAAVNADNGNSSFFSNAAEHKTIGAWHMLENPNRINGSYNTATQVMYAGTSFSAPMWSALKAIGTAH